MADEKKVVEVKHKGHWLEILDRVVTFVTALFTIPIIGAAIKEVADQYGKHAAKKIADRLGVSTEEAKHDPTEEIILGAVVRQMRVTHSEQAKEVRAFESRLRNDKAEGRKDYASAFVLYIAKGVEKFSVTKKPRQQGNQKNQKPKDADKDQQDEFAYKDITAGVEWAISFLEEVLEVVGYEERVQFLKDRNVFSLIHPPKSDPFGPAIAKAKELGAKGLEKGKELAMDAGEKIAEHHRTNAEDLSQSSKVGLERAREFRDRMRARVR